ncbi:divinyl protochlorophyllide a 8-vinyl-reductase [Roseovarius tolerans]|uniref:Divinyl protochlorophyllide a 8-vinyl-reductase n=2 Tax=Roseovarius tolerans TaxID=74031 RepID=A0A1H8FK70_9RHOB|nr:bacteriochlorophyll 4-vinyl reductase [Roseovarius tolerans]SEN32016.1 divinyl protochlorophyllide a 8-vinyl-reductase [Roseovarius tolerans]
MPDGGYIEARIGPNAVLQLAPAMDRFAGEAARRALFAPVGFDPLPGAEAMIDERPVAALHRALRRGHPDIADRIARAAGTATGDYILANRIPRAGQTLLCALPASLAAPLLTRAILAHGWTFCGSGQLTARGRHPVVFTLENNPIPQVGESAAPVCHWHAACFERLFTRLVHRHSKVVETTCCATGAAACRFAVSWR